MTTVDNPQFLASGGYLQKGRDKNVRPVDLGKKTHDLAPSRYVFVCLNISRYTAVADTTHHEPQVVSR